jgi:hypothetical protein
MDDMVAKGRAHRPVGVVGGIAALCRDDPELVTGEKNGNARLAEDDVRDIRRRFVRTGPRKSNAKELAVEKGVSHELILQIVKGQRWSHVE